MKKGIFFISALMLVGCSKKLSCLEYLDYNTKNSSEFEVKLEDDLQYTLTYIPVEKVVAENAVADASIITDLKPELSSLQKKRNTSFQLKIGVKSGNLFTQNKSAKAEQVKYYSVDFKNDIFAINTLNDTLPCSGYFFQANGGFGNESYFYFDIPAPVNEIKNVLISPEYLTDSVLVMDLTGLQHEYPKLKLKL